jgi:hypothetical protein
MSDVKTVSLTGLAAQSMGWEPKKRKTRSKRKGGAEDPAEEAAPPVQRVVAAPIAPPPPMAPVAPPMAAPAEGGARSIRVELKRRQTAKKVQLHPKRTAAATKTMTKKARRVMLGVSSQHKRMTRAKKMHHAIKVMPIATLREQLVKKGLIKATSKAPETVLRQMAADAQIVAAKAL